MRMWMLLIWAATWIPLLCSAVWLFKAAAPQWNRLSRAFRYTAVGAWLLLSLMLGLFPHQDTFTGLDNMAYRQMSHAFLDGRGFHDPDVVLKQVPEELRENFLYRRGPWGRPTRDCVFQLSGWTGVKTEPFFIPLLPLMSGAFSPVIPPEWMMPLTVALLLGIFFMAGGILGGVAGILAATATVLGLGGYAWFFRGTYSEVMGAMLIVAAVLCGSACTLRGWRWLVWSFALGLAISFHPSLIVLAAPILLGYLLEWGCIRTTVAMGVGFIGGLFPLWAITRWICRPYGNILNWQSIRLLLAVSTEHRIMAHCLLALLLLFLIVGVVAHVPAMRTWFSKIPRKWETGIWLVAGLSAFAILAFLPGETGMTLRRGAVLTWDSWHGSMGGLALCGIGLLWACVGRRPLHERIWTVAICWSLLLFLFIRGMETSAGMWSSRRLAPWILTTAAVGLVSFIGLLQPIFKTHSRSQGWVAIGLLILSVYNLSRTPCDPTPNEKGALQLVSRMEKQMASADWVIFDYFPHSVPYAVNLKHRALGVNMESHTNWPDIMNWLVTKPEQGETVYIVSSWGGEVTLEENIRLTPIYFTENLLPTDRHPRHIRQTVMEMTPADPSDITLVQNRSLDESPIGLRGPWGQLREVGGQDARWTRQGSGIIGPLPQPGESVMIRLEAYWGNPGMEDWTSQTVLITPPWGGKPVQGLISEELHTCTVEIKRPLHDEIRPATGIYRISVERPYDPAPFGVHGYDSDLGVLLRHVRIQKIPPSL